MKPEHPLVDGLTADAPLIRAYRGERPERTPVWFMRQAGRSLPEYRELRAGGDMLQACLTPDMASEITLQPVRRHGVDAAIFFSDIVVPVLLAGVDVRIVAGRGPVLDSPVPITLLEAWSAMYRYGTVRTSRYTRLPFGLIHVLCGPIS